MPISLINNFVISLSFTSRLLAISFHLYSHIYIDIYFWTKPPRLAQLFAGQSDLRDLIAPFFSFAGVAIFGTPGFQITKDPFLVGWAGYIFCYLFANSFFVFLLSKASILTVTLLALERWFSVIRPFRYKVFFAKKKLIIYVVCIFVLSAVLQIYKFFQIKFEDNKCVYVRLKAGRQVFVLSYVIVTFILPSMITWASFIHIWYRIKLSPSLIGRTEQAQVHERLLLRMCALTATVLTVCWLPTQLFYVFRTFYIGRDGYEAIISWILSMSNSIVNPWIYFLSNKDYRKAFLSIHWICKKTAQVSPERAIPETHALR